MCSFRKYPMCRFIVSENTVSTDTCLKEGLLKIPSWGGTQTQIGKHEPKLDISRANLAWDRGEGGGEKPTNFPSMEVGLDVFWNNTIVWDKVTIPCSMRNKPTKDNKRMQISIINCCMSQHTQMQFILKVV